ncbi:MAG: FAD-dependent oxidoreductase, partial [Planctomycetales bacterium]|nr:FAD-dependent oxidoreductase [Planctomycetales bacterium]
LCRAEFAERFPTFRWADEHVAIFEPTAGVLFVEACVLAMAELAAQRGAVIMSNTAVEHVDFDGRGVRVRTSRGDHSADAICVCGGAWSPALLPELPLRVVRKHLHWFSANDRCWQIARGCPAFFYETANGYFYGFPSVDDRGVKIAEHSGGEPVSDPSRVDRSVDSFDLQRVTDFRRSHLQALSGLSTDHAVCMYTLTPDEHFIVDRHPLHDASVVVSGLSGHGFKFAPALGEIAAQLTLDGGTPLPIEFLSAARFHQGSCD